MADVEPKGAVHWIDHYVVGTNDMGAWADWAVNATGITRRPLIGLTTAARKRNIKITCFLWWDGGSCRIGAFLQPEIYPPANALGEDLPRCGFYIRPEDIDLHLRRLDQHKILHTDPIRTASEGDEGTVIYLADPDGNQYEFWAPVHMPEGAMEICTSEKVGRISHVVHGARDLGRTAAFFEKYCGIQPVQDSKTAEGTLVLRLRAGGRIVYKLVDRVDVRVSGHGTWWDMHTALTVRQEEFLPNYRRMWDRLPEEVMGRPGSSLNNRKRFRRARVASQSRRYQVETICIAAMSSTTGTATCFAFRSKMTDRWHYTRPRTGRIFDRAPASMEKSAQPGLMEGLEALLSSRFDALSRIPIVVTRAKSGGVLRTLTAESVFPTKI
jgi:hypothetical protein